MAHIPLTVSSPGFRSNAAQYRDFPKMTSLIRRLKRISVDDHTPTDESLSKSVSKTPTNWPFPDQVQSTFSKQKVSSKDINYSTKHVRDVLGLTEKKPGSKPRLLHLLTFFSLDPITSLKDPNVLLKAWKGFVECHYRFRQAGLEHGDISVWNLMWNRNEQSGVLNDFDLAVFQDINIGKCITADNSERTGTLPFMALGLLTKKYYDGRIEHQYHNELESFIWVLTWLCLYDAGDNVKEKLAKWKTRYYDHLLARKLHFTYNLMDIVPKSGFEKLWDVNRKLLRWVVRQNTPTYWTRHRETFKSDGHLYKDMEEIMEKAEREYNFNLDSVD